MKYAPLEYFSLSNKSYEKVFDKQKQYLGKLHFAHLNYCPSSTLSTKLQILTYFITSTNFVTFYLKSLKN